MIFHSSIFEWLNSQLIHYQGPTWRNKSIGTWSINQDLQQRLRQFPLEWQQVFPRVLQWPWKCQLPLPRPQCWLSSNSSLIGPEWPEQRPSVIGCLSVGSARSSAQSSLGLSRLQSYVWENKIKTQSFQKIIPLCMSFFRSKLFQMLFFVSFEIVINEKLIIRLFSFANKFIVQPWYLFQNEKTQLNGNFF